MSANHDISMRRAMAGRWLCVAGVCTVLAAGGLKAQDHTDDAATRFGFAQSYLGTELGYTPSLGRAPFLTDAGVEEVALPAALTPKVTVGGTHFWGHADFYVTFAVDALRRSDDLGRGRSVSLDSGIETGARAYPWRLEPGRVRPFVGAGWTMLRYHQEASDRGRGPMLSLSRVPLQAGAAMLGRGGMLEAGVRWLPGTEIDYPVSRNATAVASLPGTSVWLTYKYLFDATRGAEAAVRRGEIEAREEAMAARGELNSIALAVGSSNAVPLTGSSHTSATHPHLEDRPPASAFPELSVGYYHHSMDAAVRLAYRPITQRQTGYGVEQTLRRRAISLEALKFLADYHGFVPFLGAGFGPARLMVRERDEGVLITDRSATRWSPTVVFGWDIRPTRVNWWLIRTNLRYTPGLQLATAPGRSVAFDHLELNLIQWVVYPRRIFTGR